MPNPILPVTTDPVVAVIAFIALWMLHSYIVRK